ncbi:high mobility group protein DSP1-like isoform X2 [Dendronephthya gigantea]|nr:high mobility group protein DSP1-like isoform X2 [Dendronephthya gigantea]
MPRRSKDPNKPKGKMAAYTFFVQSEREAMRIRNKENGKSDMPGGNTSFAKFCSEKWKCLDDAKKAPFLKLAEADKERYEKEMATYVPSEDNEASNDNTETPKTKKSRKRKRHVDENHPKRNKAAFMFFCDDHRSKVSESQPELKITEVSKVLGKMWAAIDPEKKEIYNKMAGEDRERYAKEMEEYRKTTSEDTSSAKKQK